ncbi:MAG: two-component system response regulator [Proteobacteria bacterium]|nr:MAG: two-component system response regulator [Pseudomonadota bacterium]
METLAKQVGCTPRCKNTQAATDKSATPNAKPLADTQVHADQADALAPKQSYLALVIDDSAPIRKQLEIELRTTGIKCEFAESGEEALDKIAHHDYDLIFLDIMMPGIDGYETCGKIRKDPRYKRTPVIMLSGKDTPLDEVKGVIAGASTYLTKPIKHQQFKEVIQRIIRWLNDFR